MSKLRIETTWDVYREALIAARLRPEDYDDVRTRLAGAEETRFFPRFEHGVAPEEKILLEDYRATALAIRDARHAWEGGARPVRSLSRDCDYSTNAGAEYGCEFARLCTAVLTGKDITPILAQHYTTPAERADERR